MLLLLRITRTTTNNFGGVAQSGRAARSQRVGQGFKPLHLHQSLWGRSTVANAPALQAGNREFESLRLHFFLDVDMVLW